MVKNRLNALQLKEIARTFTVLADQNRLLILHTLQKEPCYVHELCQKTSLKQANVSKQLGILRHAGLVDAERHGNLVRYSVTEPLIFELCNLVCDKIERTARQRFAEFVPASRRSRTRRQRKGEESD